MKEIRVDTHKLRPDRLELVVEWIRSLGVKPEDVRPVLAIVQREQEYELHLSRMLRNDAGKLRLDRATGDVVSEPLILGIGTEAIWPSFEGGIIE